MPKFTLQISVALFMLFTVHSVTAQELTNKVPAAAAAPVITGTASAERMRFTAPNSVVQMHLQVYADSGQLLLDVTSKGNVLDWTMQDGSGEHLVSGSYLCVVTVKSLSGRLSQRTGSVLVQEKQVELQPVDAKQFTPAQQQAVGPIEENGALTILKGAEGEAATILANDGKEGQMIRGRGALSFRIGDFFSGTDTEQMRLTEEGNLGIGTAKPKTKLDVAGTIRAREGFQFSDGSKLNVNNKGALSLTGADGIQVPNVAGTGTQDRLAKWTDSAGTLGDSLLGENSGGVELRPAVPGAGVNPILTNSGNVAGFAALRFYPATGPNTNMSFSVVPRGVGAANNRAQFSIFSTDVVADPNNYEFAAMRARDNDFVLGTGKSGTGQTRPFMLAAGFLNDNVTNDGQFYLASNGNVGVGTTAPATKLDVAGDVNTSTQYNIRGDRVLTVSNNSGAGGRNLFAGVGAGQNTTGGNAGGDNSFFGFQSGFSNSSGSFNSFFGRTSGGANNSGGGGTFVGFLAGLNNTSGSSNTFIGASTGSSNTIEDNNTFIGNQANGAVGITNATAVGFRASVTQSNSLVLGSINTVNGATADVRVGIGTTAPAFKLQVIDPSNLGLRVQTNLQFGTVASFGGLGEFQIDAPGLAGGRLVVKEDGKVGIGTTAPETTLQVDGSSEILSTGTGAGFKFRDRGSNSNTDDWAWYSSGNVARFFGGGSDLLTVSTTGNLGVGASSLTARLKVAGGDAAITTQSKGLILRATDGGTCYRVTVNNVGNLNTAAVACP